jgi:outer membrane lipoprotein carrier protein
VNLLKQGIMKKNIILLAIAALFTTTMFAQSDGDTQEMKDPKAKAILDKLSAKNKTYTTISADFDYNLKNVAEGIDETQSGKLVTKNEKYKLNIAGQEITSNGTTVWTFIEDANEVQINNVSTDEDEEGMFNPATIFTIYEKGFKYKFDSENETTQTINLYPEDANDKSYHTVQLVINKAKTQISSIIIKAKDGNTYAYILKSFETNMDLSDADFNFDTSKVEEILDLRD